MGVFSLFFAINELTSILALPGSGFDPRYTVIGTFLPSLSGDSCINKSAEINKKEK